MGTVGALELTLRPTSDVGLALVGLCKLLTLGLDREEFAELCTEGLEEKLFAGFEGLFTEGLKEVFTEGLEEKLFTEEFTFTEGLEEKVFTELFTGLEKLLEGTLEGTEEEEP